MTRRLYASETWIAIVGLSLYLAITEIAPRLQATNSTEPVAAKAVAGHPRIHLLPEEVVQKPRRVGDHPQVPRQRHQQKHPGQDQTNAPLTKPTPSWMPI